MDESRIFVTGSSGQLGTALKGVLPGAHFSNHHDFDMTDPTAYKQVDWDQYDTIINAAAMTNVDGAETTEGNELAQKINVDGVKLLADTATTHDLVLVHVSSDYVFDGTKTPHTEDEEFAPLSNYGRSKADGDIAAAAAPKYYIARTTWVVGKGKNFVRTMWDLAHRDIKPGVVDDQIGRLTFADDLAAGIKHLLETHAAYGTYNLTNDGEVASWADFARIVYVAAGKSTGDVTGVTTAEYYAGKEGIAPRPLQSELDLSKIKSTGFNPRNWREALDEYLNQLASESV